MANVGKTWTEADDSELRRLHGQNLSLRDTARRMDRHPSTITSHAKKLGLSFAARVAALEPALAANQVDRKARRARQIEALNDIIDWRTQELQTAKESGQYTALVYLGGGLQGEVILKKIPPADLHKEAQAIAILLARVEALEKIDGDGGMAEAKGMLGSILGALRSSVSGLPRMNPTAPGSGGGETK